MGKTILILHGWGAGAKSFAEVVKLLKEKGYFVYIFDLPGFGNTLPPSAPWTVDDYVKFALEFVDSQKFDKFFLFGHSFGGRIAIKFASSYPEKLAGIILCDAAGITPRSQIKIAIFSFFSRIGNWLFSFSILKPLRGLARKFAYFLGGGKDYYSLQNDVMRETFKKVIEEDLTSYLAGISAPTLLVWGRRDKLTPVSDAHRMNKGIANSELVVLDSVGHAPHIESPKELADIVDKFISKN